MDAMNYNLRALQLAHFYSNDPIQNLTSAQWFRFKSEEERIPLHQIVEECFPRLLVIFSKLVQIHNPPIEVADLIKLICKIFWSSIYVCYRP
jgi:hypothetical protein